jgi:zinc D-Ala-D-Ala carboxypeptidase
MYDYTRWPHFSRNKLVCQHTGDENPNVSEFTDLMDKLETIRVWYGEPMYVTSAYRSPAHPIEARKLTPGQHSVAAIDFRVPTEDCHEVVRYAFDLGFTGIGINLKGPTSKRFIHLDKRCGASPRIWSY